MKKLARLLTLVALSAFAQEQQVVQSGTPAVLEAANGKKLQVFLQRMDGSNLTFQPRKSPNDMTVPSSKISSLQFFPKYDAAAVEEAFSVGDYNKVLSVLEPIMEPLEQYMPIANNLQDTFLMLMKSRFAMADFTKVRQSCDLLLANDSDPKLTIQGTVYKALAALAESDVPTAQTLMDGLESEAAKLYLRACIERAQQQPKTAIQTVTGIIAEHGNDVDWLAPSELLSAHLYLDMAMTNSALNTARQVRNIYAGTHISGDADKLYRQLGGEEAATDKQGT